MDYIFRFHPNFKVETLNTLKIADPKIYHDIRIEGGDVLIAREDVLVIGTGVRTSTQGIDFIIEAIKEQQAMINQNQEENSRAIASLKEKVKVEKEKNESLKSELEAMKAYLCSKDAKAPFCQK